MTTYDGHHLASRSRFSIVVSRPLTRSLAVSPPPALSRVPTALPHQPRRSHSPDLTPGLHGIPPSSVTRLSETEQEDDPLPPPLLDLNGVGYHPVTPPPSSQPSDHPRSPSICDPSSQPDISPSFPVPRSPPSTWADLVQRVTSYIDSGVRCPTSTPMTDELLDAFVVNLESSDRWSPLYSLRYTYAADTKMLITRCMPVPEHDAVQGVFEDGLAEMIRQKSLTRSERRLFSVRVGTDVTGFTGGKEGSRKRADLVVYPQKDLVPDPNDSQHDDNGSVNGDFPSIAVEVGFSEGYDQLKKDMELWLVGSGGNVRVVVLINLTETPTYSGKPFTRPSMGSGGSSSWSSQGPYGPILSDGHVLVGEISGIVELWRLDPATSLPHLTSRHTVLPPPLVPAADDCFCLTLADIFGGEERVPDRLEPLEDIRFEFDTYRLLLARSMREHGRQRLQEAAMKKRKREREDPEWVPEHGTGGASSKKLKE